MAHGKFQGFHKAGTLERDALRARKWAFVVVSYAGDISSTVTAGTDGTFLLGADGKWELRFGLGKHASFLRSSIYRYPLDIIETGEQSCEVSVRDLLKPGLSAKFELATTSADALRAAVSEWQSGSGVVLVTAVENYEGMSPFPATTSDRGLLALTRDCKWTLFDKSGGLARYEFDVVATGDSSCRVSVRDKQDPTVVCSFDGPEVSAAALTEAVAVARDVRQTANAALARAQKWWTELPHGDIITSCHFAGATKRDDIGTLSSTEAGLAYLSRTGKTTVRIPWQDITNIEVLQSQAQRGRQRSAIGVGPIGLAVVGATMLHNHNAAKADVKTFLRITNNKAQHGDFIVTASSTANGAQALVGMFQSSRRLATEAQRALKATAPAPPPVAVSVADELAKLADLHQRAVLTDEEFAQQKAKLLSA